MRGNGIIVCVFFLLHPEFTRATISTGHCSRVANLLVNKKIKQDVSELVSRADSTAVYLKKIDTFREHNIILVAAKNPKQHALLDSLALKLREHLEKDEILDPFEVKRFENPGRMATICLAGGCVAGAAALMLREPITASVSLMLGAYAYNAHVKRLVQQLQVIEKITTEVEAKNQNVISVVLVSEQFNHIVKTVERAGYSREFGSSL